MSCLVGQILNNGNCIDCNPHSSPNYWNSTCICDRDALILQDDPVLPTCRQCNVTNHEVSNKAEDRCKCDTYNNYINAAPGNSDELVCVKCPENSISQSETTCRCLFNFYVQKTEDVMDGCAKCQSNSYPDNNLHKCICNNGYVIDVDD